MASSDRSQRRAMEAGTATRTDPGTRPTGPENRSASPPRTRAGGAFRVALFLALGFLGGYAFHLSTGPDDDRGVPADDAPEAGAAEAWTCSMHPQIRQPKPGLCPLCAMDLIPASAGGEDEEAGLRELSISREARELLNIEALPVERRHVTATVRMVGKVDYDETRLGSITAWVPGRLDRLYVDYTGIEVRKGDHMVSIYSPELYSAQAELIRARQASGDRRSTAASMSADRLLESAREKLRLWGLTASQVEEIERRDEPTDHLTIHAPMAGVVIEKNLQEGAYVDVGTRIYAIADLSHVWVRLDAYESDLAWLRYGQEVEFSTEAYPGEAFLGRVAFIDPVLNPRTRTAKVRVDVPNPEGKLKPEMFVKGRVRASVAPGGRVVSPGLADSWLCRMHPGVVSDAEGDCELCEMPLVRAEDLGLVAADDDASEPLVVPASAVLQTGARAVVYVERPDADRPTYEGREIVLGPRAGDSYIVRSGLSEGERVVVNGNFKLDSALQLLAKPSMMSPDAGAPALGHDQGRPAPDLPDAEDDRPRLPPRVSGQLARVSAAAREVAEAAEAGDRDAIRAALRSFEEALDAVDAGPLDGRDALDWKELAMRLRNGAVEGRWAASEARLLGSIDALMRDVDRLRGRFHVPEEAGLLLAGGPFEVPGAFRARLSELWRAYLDAQEALADDDPAAAREAAEAARGILSGIDPSPIDEEAREAWDLVLPEFRDAIERMAVAGDLDTLREAFEGWSIALAPALSSFGLGDDGGPVFQIFCPMAFDDRGASWLQAGEEVRNPYFGASMLRCARSVDRLALADEAGDDREGPDDE